MERLKPSDPEISRKFGLVVEVGELQNGLRHDHFIHNSLKQHITRPKQRRGMGGGEEELFTCLGEHQCEAQM
jgi:hypothetical protein